MNEKEELLIEATIDLFAKEGFWNTPTTKIAKHAGVGTGTLFNYFPSKRDLIDSVYTQLKREMITYLEDGYPETEDVKTRFAHFCRQYAEWGISNPVRFSLMEQLKLSDMVSLDTKTQLQEENHLARGLIEECLEQGLLIDISADYAGYLLGTIMNSATNFAIFLDLQGEALTKHLEQSFAICWNALSR